jgi:hypothetical protein
MASPGRASLTFPIAAHRSARGRRFRHLWNHYRVSDRQDREREPDERRGAEKPHDILAAEEFGIGTRDDRYPGDPTGMQDPHDVLAAEEFAMPAPGGTRGAALTRRDPRGWIPLIALAVVVAAFLRRRR